MTVYVFDGTMDGLLTAVFDAFALKEQPEQLLAEGDALPLFCDHTYHVTSDEEKARRVWAGLEKKLTREALRLISVSWLSELRELNTPLFHILSLHLIFAANTASTTSMSFPSTTKNMLRG